MTTPAGVIATPTAGEVGEGLSGSKSKSMAGRAQVSLLQTWGMVAATGSHQTVVFKQDIGVTTAQREGDGVIRPLAEPGSRLRPITEENLQQIAAALMKGGHAVWAESVGSVVLLVSADEIGYPTSDADVLSLEVDELTGTGDDDGGMKKGPRKIYYYAEGRRPRVPAEWLLGGTVPKIPSDVRPKILDGMMRLTAVHRHNISVDVHAHVWVIPSQQLAEMPPEMIPIEWLSDILTSVAKSLNDAAKTHAKSSFVQQLIECAKHRTSRVKSTGRHRKVLRGKKGADENAKSQVTRASVPVQGHVLHQKWDGEKRIWIRNSVTRNHCPRVHLFPF